MKKLDNPTIAQMPYAEIEAAFVATTENPNDREAEERFNAIADYYYPVVRGAIVKALLFYAPVEPLYEDKEASHLIIETNRYLELDTCGPKGKPLEVIWLGRAYQLGYIDFGYDEDFTFGVVSPYENVDLIANNAY